MSTIKTVGRDPKAKLDEVIHSLDSLACFLEAMDFEDLIGCAKDVATGIGTLEIQKMGLFEVLQDIAMVLAHERKEGESIAS